MDKSRLSTRSFTLGCIIFGVMFNPLVQGIFREQGWRWAYILLVSGLASFLLTPVIRNLALRYSILDQPAARKVHLNATPLLGGLAVYLGFLLSLLVNNLFTPEMSAILGAGTLVMLVSLVDDIRELPAKLKLAVQLLAATLVIMGGIQINLFPRHGVGELAATLGVAGNLVLTYLWILGITNAMNFLDGIDGLATGLGMVISLFLGLVAFQTGQVFLGWFSIALLGSCMGFLPYNFRRSGPAAIFLGDTGSIFIGFILSCLAIASDWAEMDPLVSIYAPVMIFGVLIFDMTHTTVARIAKGKVRNFHQWVEYVGKDHIHHRMAMVFQDKRKAVLMILGMSGCLGVSGVIMPNLNAFDSSLMVSQAIFGFMMFSAVNHYHKKSLMVSQPSRPDRVQVHSSVLLHCFDRQLKMDASLVDVSETGAKITLRSATPLDVGDEVGFAGENRPRTDPSWMRGQIVWKKEVTANGSGLPFLECGIRFVQNERKNITEVVTLLAGKQPPLAQAA